MAPAEWLLVVRTESAGGGVLSEEQYNRVKLQIDDQFTGAANAGRPILLEGGLKLKQLGCLCRIYSVQLVLL